MTTIPRRLHAETEGLARSVYDDILSTYKAYNLTEPHVIYQLMGHTPEFLAPNWQRSRYLYGGLPEDMDTSASRFSLKDKHLVTLGVSATNNCEYCVRIHTMRLRQLGMNREEQVELMSVVAATNGFDKLAEGTRVGDQPTLPAADTPLLDEIRQAAGNHEPDQLFSLLAHRPELLEALWRLAQRCFHEEGKLGLRSKHLVAFGVAAANSTDYYVRHHLERLRELGLSDDDLVELLLIVDLACGYNRYVQGMQIQPEANT